jgi:hypothetical protein
VSTNDQSNRSAGVTSAEEIGKVFVVVGQDVRRCLICEGVFSPSPPLSHSAVPCMPGITMKTGGTAVMCAATPTLTDFAGSA